VDKSNNDSGAKFRGNERVGIVIRNMLLFSNFDVINACQQMVISLEKM
jgi:hypothetical protein